MNPWLGAKLLAVLACAAPVVGWAAPATITPEMQAEDPRLGQRVTLVGPRLYIGDLLERLAGATGVKVEADPNDGAADQPVWVWLRDVRLGDALDALWSLLSYKGATWRWERTRAGGAYEYTLSRPLAAQRLARTIQDDAQRAFEEQAEAVLSAVDASDDERATIARHVPSAAPLIGERGRLADGVRLFRDFLSPDAQRAVLRGETYIKVPTTDLPPDGQRLVHQIWADSHAEYHLPDGSTKPVPEPSYVVFLAPRNPTETTQTMTIQLENIGGYGYLGGVPLDRAFAARWTDRWMQPGDAGRAPVDTAAAQLKADAALRPKTDLERSLSELSAGMGLSIMARLPREGPHCPDLTPGRPLHEWLTAQATDYPYTAYKWRGNVLLIAPGAWFKDPAMLTPPKWQVVRYLRKAEQASGGTLELADVCYGACRLTPDQMLIVSEEFPICGARSWHPLFSRLGRSGVLLTQMLGEKGVSIGPMLGDIEPIVSVADRARTGEVTHARLDYGSKTEDGVIVRSLELDLLDRAGKVVQQVGGFSWKPRSAFKERVRPARPVGMP